MTNMEFNSSCVTFDCHVDVIATLSVDLIRELFNLFHHVIVLVMLLTPIYCMIITVTHTHLKIAWLFITWWYRPRQYLDMQGEWTPRLPESIDEVGRQIMVWQARVPHLQVTTPPPPVDVVVRRRRVKYICREDC